MLRFIIRHQLKDAVSGLEFATFETLDAECPELESILNQGGYGENGYDCRLLAGVEIRPSQGERDE